MEKHLKSNTIVYIDPIVGWHYHMKNCPQAGMVGIEFGKVITTNSSLGVPYIFHDCVIKYMEAGIPTGEE